MTTLVGQKKGKNIDVSTDGQRLVYSATREYLVYDQSGNAGEGDVLVTAGLPSVNLFYNFDGVPLALTCKKKSAQQWETNNKYWTVSADFDNEPQNNENDTGGNEGDSQDPTTWNAIVRFNFEQYEDVLWHEKNLANRPYASPLTIQKLIPVLKFTQYMPPTLTIYDLITEYHDVLNDDTFLGSNILRSWLLTVADAQYGVTNGYECWKVDFELRYKVVEFPNTVWQVTNGNPANVTDPGGVYGGWDYYIPQLDTINVNSEPFEDTKLNSGDLGKIDESGDFISDQTDDFVLKVHTIRKSVDFSFLRISQA